MPEFFPPPAPPPPPLKRQVAVLIPQSKLPSAVKAGAPVIAPTAHILVPIKATPQLANVAGVLGAQGMATAHGLAQAGAGGDAAASATIIDILSGARAGDPGAISAANALSTAQKLQTQAKYVAKWVGTPAALEILKGAHMGLVQFRI